MTRPIERIKPILKIIEEAWMKYPYLRLGQLLENAWVCYQTEDLTNLVENFSKLYGTTPLLWGTYGKDWKQPLTYKKVEDLDAPHIYNILSTQELRPETRVILRNELHNKLWIATKSAKYVEPQSPHSPHRRTTAASIVKIRI